MIIERPSLKLSQPNLSVIITSSHPPCRRKLQNKLKASDEALTELQSKYSSLDKAKHRIEAELEDVNLDLEKEKNRAQAIEKKQKQVDRQITEWKSKFDGKEAELDQAKKECHATSTEVR